MDHPNGSKRVKEIFLASIEIRLGLEIMVIFCWTSFEYFYHGLNTFGSSTEQVVVSGQLHILRTESNIRVPGHDWVLGLPLLHLKYFLQLVGSGSSSPSWVHPCPLVTEIKTIITTKSYVILTHDQIIHQFVVAIYQ